MGRGDPLSRLHPHRWAIWAAAFGYFACYAPYSALTKALSSGLTGDPALSGFEILPYSTLASLVGMVVFLVATGWWRAASRRAVLGLQVPVPSRWTFLSGLCTAAIIGSTTLSYAFTGTSIVFMMLLMRGGVLILAPIVDALSKRPVRWTSWVALGLSLLAVVISTARHGEVQVTALAAVDVAVYLGGYFIRLRVMSHLAKRSPEENRRYFVEEQMVATPAICLALGLVAVFGTGATAAQLKSGFALLDMGSLALVALVGLLSQGTGIFGALILLDARESSFCVPINRASSILAGVVATFALWRLAAGAAPSGAELAGASLLLLAIALLAVYDGHAAVPRAESTAPSRP